MNTHNNILIIDDVQNVRDHMKNILEHEEYSVTVAESGKEAMQMIGKGAVDLIILDLVMPNMGGVEMLLQLKNNKSLKKIMMTGKVIEDQEKFDTWAKKYGVSRVLFKPFKKRELIEAVTGSLPLKKEHL